MIVSDDPASGAAETAAKAAASLEYGSQPTEKKKQKKKTEKPKPVEKLAIIEEEPLLDQEEQEFLANSIGELPEHAMDGAMAIIQEGMGVGADGSEIDLELDALPPAVQRKLYKYVSQVRNGADCGCLWEVFFWQMTLFSRILIRKIVHQTSQESR